MSGHSGHGEWEEVSLAFIFVPHGTSTTSGTNTDTHDRIEGAVKQIISGSKVKTSASVANVECLEFYRDWAIKH